MIEFLVFANLLGSSFGKWSSFMENPKLFGGDMVMSPMEIEALVNGTKAYGSIIGGRWPNAVVPYVIDRSIGRKGVAAINAAINDYHKFTCLKWKRRTNERIYARFSYGDGCSSPVGYRRYQINTISLGSGCQDKGTAIHEMGHTIGLYHEQNRPDRDKYVTIHRNQVMNGMYYNFQIERNVDSLGTEYDLRSIMHYSSTAFARGRYYTITTRDKSKQHLINHGDRVNDFSPIDIKQINLMYKCRGGGGVTPTNSPPTGDCVDTDGKCRQWAENGYCTATKSSHLETMKKKCCKSCKESYARCDDKNRNCSYWANRSECTKNPNYMLQNCPKSCNVCR